MVSIEQEQKSEWDLIPDLAFREYLMNAQNGFVPIGEERFELRASMENIAH